MSDIYLVYGETGVRIPSTIAKLSVFAATSSMDGSGGKPTKLCRSLLVNDAGELSFVVLSLNLNPSGYSRHIAISGTASLENTTTNTVTSVKTSVPAGREIQHANRTG